MMVCSWARDSATLLAPAYPPPNYLDHPPGIPQLNTKDRLYPAVMSAQRKPSSRLRHCASWQYCCSHCAAAPGHGCSKLHPWLARPTQAQESGHEQRAPQAAQPSLNAAMAAKAHCVWEPSGARGAGVHSGLGGACLCPVATAVPSLPRLAMRPLAPPCAPCLAMARLWAVLTLTGWGALQCVHEGL